MIPIDKILEYSMVMLPSLIESDKIHMSYILDGNHIVSFGSNSRKTHPTAYRLNYRYPSLHSELACFINRPNKVDVSDMTLVNIRLSRLSYRHNRPILRISKPCIDCDRWVKNMFKSIWYTDNNNFVRLM